MPQTCTVCSHLERPGIEEALTFGTPLRTIADRYGPSKTALLRHRDNCLAGALASVQAATVAAGARTIVDQIHELQATTLRILQSAESAQKLGTAVMAITAARQNLELLAKISGELDERPQINILVTPQWQRIEEALARALEWHPDVLEGIRAELSRIE